MARRRRTDPPKAKAVYRNHVAVFRGGPLDGGEYTMPSLLPMLVGATGITSQQVTVYRPESALSGNRYSFTVSAVLVVDECPADATVILLTEQ